MHRTAPFDPGTPHAAREHLGALERLESDGRDMLGSLDDLAFFAPQGAYWSPAVHVRHLRKATVALARGLALPRWMLRLRFGRARRPSRDFAGLRDTYLAALAAGAQAGRFAPNPASAAPSASYRTEIMDGWGEAHRALEGALAPWPEAALDRYLLPHPILGKLTVREMLSFTVYHTAHHLNRVIERAQAAPLPVGEPGR